MRCKNCGTYNDDNRYICETCGSPLYDEEEINSQENNGKTQTFNAVAQTTEQNNSGYNDKMSSQDNSNNQKDNPEKKSAIVIAILVVVLVAVIISIAVVAHNKSKANDDLTSNISISESTSLSTTASTTTEKTTESTTASTTTTERTTVSVWYINVSSSGGGSVSGAGEFNNGEKVTITAVPDDGYAFDGWYSNGVKISNKEKYSFTANENASFSAQFTFVQDENTGIENGADLV